MKIESIIKLMKKNEEIFIEDHKTFKVYHDGIIEDMPNELKELNIKRISTGNNILILYIDKSKKP